MRILHTADWHLGKRLQDRYRLKEQRDVLDEITTLAEREAVDLVLIAGDLFDTFNPSAEAEDLLYSTLKRLSDGGKRAVVAIAGNHDNPDRLEAQDHFARECGIVFAGFPQTEVKPFSCDVAITRSAPGFVELQLPNQAAPVRIILTPYANELRMRTFLGTDVAEELRQVLKNHWQHLADTFMNDAGVNLLVAHLFMMARGGEAPQESDDEKSILHVGGASVMFTDMIPTPVQYVALGHLHRYQQLAGGPCPIIYSSSPLAYSFAESEQQKYVVLIDVAPGQPATVTPVPLTMGKQLLRPRFTHVEEAVTWLTDNHDCYVEMTMETDTFLTSEELQQLQQAHHNLVTIIPDVKTAPSETATASAGPTIDLQQSMDDLFSDYFTYRHKQLPNDRLKTLFREILAAEPE